MELRSLSIEEMCLLSKALHDTMLEKSGIEDVDVLNEIGNKYVKAMNRIIGRNILDNRRDATLVWGRAFVIWQLFKDGFTEMQIGAMMGKDHSTIHHVKEKVKTAMKYPAAYRQEMKMWTDFQLEIS